MKWSADFFHWQIHFSPGLCIDSLFAVNQSHCESRARQFPPPTLVKNRAKNRVKFVFMNLKIRDIGKIVSEAFFCVFEVALIRKLWQNPSPLNGPA